MLISQAITIANGLSAALAGQRRHPRHRRRRRCWPPWATRSSTGGVFLVLLALAGVVLALVLAVVYVMRLMALVLLAAAAPLALALYALPQTAWAARWWWRALTAAPGHPGRPGAGADRGGAGVLLPRLAALARRPATWSRS